MKNQSIQIKNFDAIILNDILHNSYYATSEIAKEYDNEFNFALALEIATPTQLDIIYDLDNLPIHIFQFDAKENFIKEFFDILYDLDNKPKFEIIKNANQKTLIIQSNN